MYIYGPNRDTEVLCVARRKNDKTEELCVKANYLERTLSAHSRVCRLFTYSFEDGETSIFRSILHVENVSVQSDCEAFNNIENCLLTKKMSLLLGKRLSRVLSFLYPHERFQDICAVRVIYLPPSGSKDKAAVGDNAAEGAWVTIARLQEANVEPFTDHGHMQGASIYHRIFV